MGSIKITTGNHGYFLNVDGMAIKKDNQSFYGITSTRTPKANNWIATEFSNLKVLREFWTKYRILILESVKQPK
jgi:hypothetical protein